MDEGRINLEMLTLFNDLNAWNKTKIVCLKRLLLYRWINNTYQRVKLKTVDICRPVVGYYISKKEKEISFLLV